MPGFLGFTMADLIGFELGDAPKRMLADLANIFAKKAAKAEEGFALLDIEYIGAKFPGNGNPGG